MHFARGGSLWELQQAGKTFFNGPNGKIISCFDQGKYPRLFCEALQHLLYLAMPEEEDLLWMVVIFLISDSFFFSGTADISNSNIGLKIHHRRKEITFGLWYGM